MVDHLETNNSLNDPQHGFRNKRSTVTQMMRYYDSILTLLEEGHAVDAIYLDFSKVFDKVDHVTLQKKLESVIRREVSGGSGAWTRSATGDISRHLQGGSTLDWE